MNKQTHDEKTFEIKYSFGALIKVSCREWKSLFCFNYTSNATKSEVLIMNGCWKRKKQTEIFERIRSRSVHNRAVKFTSKTTKTELGLIKLGLFSLTSDWHRRRPTWYCWINCRYNNNKVRPTTSKFTLVAMTTTTNSARPWHDESTADLLPLPKLASLPMKVRNWKKKVHGFLIASGFMDTAAVFDQPGVVRRKKTIFSVMDKSLTVFLFQVLGIWKKSFVFKSWDIKNFIFT